MAIDPEMLYGQLRKQRLQETQAKQARTWFRCGLSLCLAWCFLAAASCKGPSDQVSASKILPTVKVMSEELGFYYQAEHIQAVDVVDDGEGGQKPRVSNSKRMAFLLELSALQDTLQAAIDTGSSGQ